MKETLPILGIETSGDLCSVALMVSEKSFYEINILEKHIHSKKILNMIDLVLKEGGVELKQVAHIAVSMGPGSFTGLRIGLTTAKGLGFGANLPIVPVPTFHALALQVSDYLEANTNFVIIRNASVEDFYYALLKYYGSKYTFINDVDIIKKRDINNLSLNNKLIFSDIDLDFNTKKIVGPTALNICRYSYLFGKDLLTYDYDYLEPYYLKQFLVKGKK